MDEFLQLIVPGATSGGIITFLLVLVFKSRIEKSIKHEYDAKITELKNKLDTESSLVQSLQANFQNKQSIGYEKTIHAIEKLWIAMKEVKRNKPLILTTVDVLLESEFGKGFGRNKNPQIIDIDTEQEKKYLDTGQIDESSIRIFAGEYLWLLFFTYRRIIGRIVYLTKNGRLNQDVPVWWKDSGCISFINAVCDENEYQKIINEKFGKIEMTLSIIEQKFIPYANDVITGKHSTDKAFEESQRILKLLDKSSDN